ncbi:hypothetical protein WH47_11019 [Habropoda laboriosa]|uniref:Uncharacterized protein n=1 Tax=Habropoda laboriosa TaxID=597456 RepID=A0A0L7QM40_9HYME|nr:hypothetical protein WH47_11019 [Habropoda laboriosa]
MYGVELWGFKERAEIEKIQVRYIKWTLGLDIRTPGYLVLEESKREKLRVKAGIRAWKFEEGVRKDVGRKIVKECLKEKEANREQTRTGKEREEYLKRNGLSQAGVDELRREGREVTERIRRRDKEVQQQRQYTKIEQSKYNIRYKYIRTIGLPEYLSKKGRGQKIRKSGTFNKGLQRNRQGYQDGRRSEWETGQKDCRVAREVEKEKKRKKREWLRTPKRILKYKDGVTING